MMDRQHGQLVFECDNCDETLETDEGDFSEALAVFRRANWKAEKVGLDWVHTCPACRGDGGYRDF